LKAQVEAIQKANEAQIQQMHNKFRNSETKRLLTEAGIHQDFITDTEYFAEKLFTVNAEGDLVPKDSKFTTVDAVMQDFVSKHQKWVVKDTVIPSIGKTGTPSNTPTELDLKIQALHQQNTTVTPFDVLTTAFKNTL